MKFNFLRLLFAPRKVFNYCLLPNTCASSTAGGGRHGHRSRKVTAKACATNISIKVEIRCRSICLLSIAYYPLPIAYCLLPKAYYPMPHQCMASRPKHDAPQMHSKAQMGLGAG